MRVVGALLAVEVRTIAAIVVRSILGAEALVRRPRLDQRAVHGEVIVTHEALRLLVHRSEKLLCHLAVQQPVAVLGEDRMVPHRVVHAQAHEPAEQQVVVQLLDQLPLRADRVKRLQQKRMQHILGRDRGSARGRVQLVELSIQRLEHAIRQSADLAQRMIRRNTLLQRQIAEHTVLNPLVSTHTQ
jgi:hypothetical protein